MATLPAVIKEIDDIAKLTQMRTNQAMVEGLVESVATKIGTIVQWDTGSAVQMSLKIAESTLTDDCKSRLAKACDARTAAYAAIQNPARNAGGAPQRDQFMRTMNNFLTGLDWGKLDDKKTTPAQRDAVVANRLQSLGVRRGSEIGLIKWAIAILVDLEFQQTGTWPSYWSIYYRVCGFKDLFCGLPPYPHNAPEVYPEYPAQLPDCIFKEAYPDPQDPPVHRYIGRLMQVSQHIPLRRSSKLLDKDTPDQNWNQNPMLQAIQTFQSQLGWTNDGMVNGIPIHILGNMGNQRRTDNGWNFNNDNSRDSGAASHSWSWDDTRGMRALPPIPQEGSQSTSILPRMADSPVEDSPPSAAKGVDPLGLCKSKSKDEASDQHGLNDDETRASSADIEEAAFQRLLARGKTKGGKGKVKKALKKPSAAVDLPVLKRPSAKPAAVPAAKPAPIKVNYVVTWSKKDGDEKRSRNVFTSKHYGRAKTHFKHLSGQKYSDSLKAVLANAGTVWDKNMKKA